MARSANVDERTRTRGQALTAIGCLKKLAERTDARAMAALQAWDTVPREKPDEGPPRAPKRGARGGKAR